MAKKKAKKQRTQEVAVVEDAVAPADYSQHPVIPLEVQLERGGNVPSLINHVPEATYTKSRELVAKWSITGSQAWWRMTCLIEMKTRGSYMKPLSLDTLAYMGQVFCLHACSFTAHMAWFLQNGVQARDFTSIFEVPMGNKKVYRFWSAWGVPWDEEQNLQDVFKMYDGARADEKIQLKAGHMVKISFGNDRVRTEPWMIRCFRHENVDHVAE